MSEIHAHAIVSPKARLGRDSRIGAYAVVGDDVDLGEGCVVQAHAVVQGPARIGRENIFHPFCSVGSDPQDLKYAGDTVNRGTKQGGGVTRIGDRNLFMAYAHVAHDCHVGSRTVFANGATLAGHVAIEDHVTVGAFSAVHQFCRVGRHAYIGGFTVVTQDVSPFSKVVSERETKCYGANSIGLERSGFEAGRIRAIEQAYRLLLRSKLNTTQAIERMRATLNGSADVEELIRFIETAERGLTK